MDKQAQNNLIPVYLEVGRRRVFAGALDWPGWCRGGLDETSALASLVDYAPRYAAVLKAAGLGFNAVTGVSSFALVERLPGNATTDFGAPDAVPASDALPMVGEELVRQQAILDACWQAFAASAAAAVGKELRKGPRGGGRDLDWIRGTSWKGLAPT